MADKITPAAKSKNLATNDQKTAGAQKSASVKPAQTAATQAKPSASVSAQAKPNNASAKPAEPTVDIKTELLPDGRTMTIKTVHYPASNGQPGRKVITKSVSSTKTLSKTTVKTHTTTNPVTGQPQQQPQVNINVEVNPDGAKKVSAASKIQAFFRNKFVLFGLLIIIIAASAFFLLLADKENFVRKAIGLDVVPFFATIGKIFGVGEYFNVGITSWFIMFILWFSILAIFAMIFLRKPAKTVYANKHKLSMDEKKGFGKFNAIYYISFILAIAVVFVVFFLVFPFNQMDFSKAVEPLKNVFQSVGLFVIMLLIIPACILVIVLVFKLLVFLLSLIIGNVSRNVMSSQNYQEALSATQLAAAKIQKEVEEEARKKKEQEEKEKAEKDKKGKENDDGTVGGGTGAGLAAGGFGNTTLGGHQKVMFPALTKLDASLSRKKSNEKPSKAKGKSDSTPANDKIDLLHLVNGFQSYLANRKQLYYELNMLRGFVGGLACSRLLLLQGLSGTGKSTLPREFAEYTDNSATFYPVQATWRDKTDLVGYFSDFTGEYKETELLKTLYRAGYTPKTVYLLVLDEANISRMEYYFADFLSIYEYPSDNWLIPLIQPRKDDKLPNNLEEGKVRIPVNTWFVATVNIDDSTFTISDKVYDRAMVLDFNAYNEPIKTKYDDKPYPMTKAQFDEAVKKAQAAAKNNLTPAEKAKFMKLITFVSDTFDCKIGNRVINQIDNFVPVFVACGGSKDNALDIMFANKVLRKVDNLFESYVEDGLTRLSKLVTSTYGAKNFPLTIATIAKIKKKFN